MVVDSTLLEEMNCHLLIFLCIDSGKSPALNFVTQYAMAPKIRLKLGRSKRKRSVLTLGSRVLKIIVQIKHIFILFVSHNLPTKLLQQKTVSNSPIQYL